MIFFKFLSVFCGLSIFFIYYFLASAVSFTVFSDPIPIPTYLAIVLSLFTCYFLASATQGSYIFSIKRSLSLQKTSIATYFSQMLQLSPSVFVLSLLRDILWIIPVVLVAVLYVMFFSEYLYLDIVSALAAFFIFAGVHMFFKPAIILACGSGLGVGKSLKQGFGFIRSKNVAYFGLYAFYGVSWLLNLVPLLNLGSLFAFYPITLGSIIAMMEKNS